MFLFAEIFLLDFLRVLLSVSVCTACLYALMWSGKRTPSEALGDSSLLRRWFPLFAVLTLVTALVSPDGHRWTSFPSSLLSTIVFPALHFTGFVMCVTIMVLRIVDAATNGQHSRPQGLYRPPPDLPRRVATL